MQPIKIEMVSGEGYWQYFSNNLIDKIWSDYNSKSCTVYYRNGSHFDVNCDCGSYNFQYGSPISNDGERLYIGYWYAFQGLCCYSIRENKLIWKIKISKNRNIYVFDSYIIVVRDETSLLKIDGLTGEINDAIKSGTIEHAFPIRDGYFLIDRVKGKIVLFDTKRMQQVKVYKKALINPNNSLYLRVKSIIYNQGVLSIEGLEDYRGGRYANEEEVSFIRVIDLDLDSVIKEYEKKFREMI